MNYKILIKFVIALIISFTSLYLGVSSTANAVAPIVEKLIDDGGNKPITSPIGELESYPGMELWHYSGGYWKYNDYVIPDGTLSQNLNDAELLAKSINDDITFNLDIGSELYDNLMKREKVKIFVSTSLPGKKINNLFDPKTIEIELNDNKIHFKAKPKLHFNKNNVNYDDFISGKLNVTVPIVDPAYGYNRYAIWKRSSPSELWGAANGYFNSTNISEHAPADSGKIAPAQIINTAGHLEAGFTINTTGGDGNRNTRTSDTSSVGSGTFKTGGAVGIFFSYPITFTFYSNEEDISADFKVLPSSAVAGDDVLVGINVRSLFKATEFDVPFKWDIKDSQGVPISGITYTGLFKMEAGTIDRLEPGDHVIYAKFKMPDNDVKVKFEINKDGKKPIETYLDNNTLDSGESIKKVSMLNTTDFFDVNYNILSRKLNFPLANSPITVQLNLPRGSWDGNATGSLNVTNEASDLFRDFQVANNPTVNEGSETITRNPVIHTTLQRTDFGDDPDHGGWLNWSPPDQPKIRSGNVSFNGSVSRPYKYTYLIGCSEKGGCSYGTAYGATSASFNSGTNTNDIRTFIYNGKQEIAPKTFEDKIDNNTTDELQKDLFWTSEKYSFDVIRWMYHQNEDKSLYNATAVDGQYQRDFIQQASGSLKWATVSTLENDYSQSRAAAKSRDYRKAEYDKAVFASDADFRNVNYPIKSGYYFNPTGTYTFEVETVTYKPTTADTKDHKDLVEAVTNSFRYESDLMYINNNREAVNLQNNPLSKKGSSYNRQLAALTAQDPTGVDGEVMLNVLDRNDSASRYTKKVEELQHSQNINGDTHEYWKDIMEGYAESGSKGSNDIYKYVEYIKDGQHMYRITEKTKVTIQINPDNRNVYTHAQMLDGKYTIKVWIANIPLSQMSPEYSKLGTLQGVSSLDEIEVSVKGSMYEDSN